MTRGFYFWLFGLVSLIIFVVFFYFRSSNKSEIRLFKAVPENAGLIFQFDNSEEIQDIFKNGNLINGFMNEKLKEEYYLIEKFFLNNSKFFTDKKKQKIIISCHKIQSNKIDILCIAKFNSLFTTDILEALSPYLSPKINLSSHNIKGQKIYDINFLEDQKHLSFYFHDDLLVLSWNGFLTENSYLNYNDNPIDDELSAIYSKFNLSNSKSPLKLFINYKELENMISAGLSRPFFDLVQPLSNAAKWSFLDLNFKQYSLQFSGYTQANFESENVLSLLKSQIPIKQDLYYNLPQNTMAILSIGLSTPELFFNSMDTSLYRKKFFFNSSLKDKYIALNKSIIENFSNEFLLALNENDGFQIEDDYYGLVKIKDFKSIENFLLGQDSYLKKLDSLIIYKGINVYKNNCEDIFSYSFGEIYKNFKSTYLFNINNFIVSCNNLNSVKLFIDNYTSLNTLNSQEDFLKLNMDIGSSSNMFFYGNANRTKNLLSFFSKSDFKTFLNSSSFDYYTSLGIKISASNSENYFTSIAFPLNTNEKKKGYLSWKVDLGSPIEFAPIKVINHQTGEIEFLVQDSKHILYLLNVNGKILWRKEIEDKILGNIFQVDYYKNDKYQYLFNTQKSIFLLDRNANSIDGFPKKLGSEANCGLAFFDYDMDKNYRIFVPCKNKSVYGFSINGKTLDGWNPKSNLGEIIYPPKHLKLLGKDYIYCNSIDGKFYFFNRKGELVAKYFDEENLYLNDFYPNLKETFAASRMVSTDSSGRLKFVYFDGRALYKTIGNWTNAHRFFYGDLGSQEKEKCFILDNKQLFVYKNDTSLEWSYQFLVEPKGLPQLFNLKNNSNFLGINSEEANQIFIFNSNGELLKGFPLIGSTRFVLLDNLDNFNLLVGSVDGNLYFYQIPK